MLNELEKEIRDTLIDKIEELDSIENDDMTDFVFQLWERENIDGSVTCDAYEAQRWIKKHFEDLGEYVENYQEEYGTPVHNPFTKSEAFQVVMCIEITMNLIGKVWEDGNTKEELLEKLVEL